jgi:transposase
MRSIGLDVHRDFCEVAIKDESGLRLAGRVRTSVQELELFAQSLAPDDQVALEATGPAQAIARILQAHVGRVVIANTRKLSAITESKVKTDKIDASTLCELLAAGFLPAVWSPDEFTRACVGVCNAARSSCAREHERRTSATRCWHATSRVARR